MKKLEELWDQYDREAKRGYVDRATTRDEIAAEVIHQYSIELEARKKDDSGSDFCLYCKKHVGLAHYVRDIHGNQVCPERT